jgi:ligand-binding sensor domain-containing protein/serine phosphatase RsbU (regulator of sigma subunit)
MMFRSIFVYLIWVTFCVFTIRSNAQIYHFENFTAENGLSQSQVLEIFQNNDGTLWLGTNNGGITIYDGNSFENLTDKDGLIDNVVFSIAADEQNQKWIGTNNGLSVYDGKNYTNYTTEEGLTHNRIFKVFFDSKGNTWLGTGKGITFYDGKSFTAFDQHSILSSTPIVDVFEDDKGRMWFSTITNGVFVYDGEIFHNYSTENGLVNDYVHTVSQQGENEYWLYTYKGLFQLLNGKIKQIEIVQIPQEDPVYNYKKDAAGNLWIGTRSGVLKYNGTTFKLYSKNNGLVENDIWKILEDKEGNLWFGSRANGLSKLFSEQIISYDQRNGLANDYIYSIHKMAGQIFIGTKRGLSIYDGITFTNYDIDDGLCSGKVLSIANDSKGTIYLGTDYGLGVRYSDGVFDSIRAEGTLTEERNLNKCFDVFVDENDEVWLGTFSGVAKMGNHQIVRFAPMDSMQSEVYQIYQDKAEKYWFCTESGLYSYDGNKVVHFNQHGLKKGRIRSISEDQNRALWVGTNDGIFNYRNGTFFNYSVEQGLASNTIYSMVFDEKGVLWLGLPNGIDRVKFKDEKIAEVKHFGANEGFTGQECNMNSILIEAENIWFGTIKSIAILQPKFEKENQNEPFTKFKSIRLESQKTDWTFFTKKIDDRGLPIDLELPYNRNHLTFDFIGVSLAAPEKVKYKYMLKGYDKKWLPITSKNEVVYSNLPPGEYEFLVMASNGYGKWNKKPVSFQFTILPPFWQTWWFYSICILIVAGGVYSYFKIRAANKKITNANVEIIKQKELVEEKNKEILDSITYAKRLQDAILPPEKLVKASLPESFILFKPKDIVSGDFYWLESPSGSSKGNVFFAAADCTGHGVPGAMVSVVCHNAMNRAVREFSCTEPAKILDKTRELVIQQFEKSEDEVKDGMDVALCSYDHENQSLQYAGANNPLWIVRELNGVELTVDSLNEKQSITSNFEQDNLSLFEIKANKQPIGKYADDKPFTNHTIQLEKGDFVYIFSDGFADQFGGPKGKKFKYSQFKKLLLSIRNKPMEEQRDILDKALEEWMGDIEQVDDVCIIGIKV